MAEEGSNRRIVKNTIFLYFRSFLMIAVNLYASRVILQALGVDDYGLYGAIGSIVAMFTIISGVLSIGTSRFLTFELGLGNAEKLRKTFSASFTMHLGMAVFLFLLLESIGLWFVNNKMNIPEGREFAANVVYQLSILTCMFNLVQVPYSASIIAHERMGIYAYVGIAEALFKLALVLVLLYIPTSDNLIAYAIILAGWQIALQLFYFWYCHRNFQEAHLTICKDKNIYKSMLSYSLWDFLGQFCATGNNQGINILINMFFGVAVNAARTIAYQVQNAITLFSNNFMTAVNPQIVKSYAQGDTKRFFELIYESGKYSYYLLFMVSLPIFLEAEYILKLWLVEVPEYTVLFLRFVMAISLFNVIERPLINGIHATGHVKVLNLTSGLYSACTFLPTVFILFKIGFPVWSCFVVLAFNSIVCIWLEIRALYIEVKFDVWDYLLKVYVHSISTSVMPIAISILPLFFMEESFMRLLVTCVSSVVSTALVVYTLGISKATRYKVNEFVKSKLIRKL